MRTNAILGLAVVATMGLAAGAIQAFACGSPLERKAIQAVADDEGVRERAIQGLRQAGPAGLNALLQTYVDQLAQHAPQDQKNSLTTTAIPAIVVNGQAQPDEQAVAAAAAATERAEYEAKIWGRVKVALDAVGGQKDNHTARLFWYTDLEEAKAAAKTSGKPILSLRLLGKLTDELSCANSRFFRTMLYPNAEINKLLRENYILHWETFRNVPIVTIDFGDGRKIVRTLTGNSIHYVLDSEGRPIDAIPGLYGPPAFLRQLQAAQGLSEKLAKVDGNEWRRVLRKYHSDREQEIVEAWTNDLKAANIPINYPSTHKSFGPMAQILDKSTTEEGWQQLAAMHAPDAQLDAAGVAAVKEKAPPDAALAGRRAISKAFVETPWMKMVRNLQGSTALDTVKNEYSLHSQIHDWYANNQVSADVQQLNDKVYAQLFLMPSTDPWLGLSTPDQFSGITNGGLVETQTAVVEQK